jgi:hypothetical protein
VVVSRRRWSVRGSGDDIGNEASLFLPPWSFALVGNEGVWRGEDEPAASLRIVVLADVSRLMVGREGIESGIALAFPSFRGNGESRRPDKADGAR